MYQLSNLWQNKKIMLPCSRYVKCIGDHPTINYVRIKKNISINSALCDINHSLNLLYKNEYMNI